MTHKPDVANELKEAALALCEAVEQWFDGPPAWANRQRKILDMARALRAVLAARLNVVANVLDLDEEHTIGPAGVAAIRAAADALDAYPEEPCVKGLADPRPCANCASKESDNV
jgi:hypothetical protein